MHSDQDDFVTWMLIVMLAIGLSVLAWAYSRMADLRADCKTRGGVLVRTVPSGHECISYSPYCYAYALRSPEVGNVYQSAYTSKKGYSKTTYDDDDDTAPIVRSA